MAEQSPPGGTTEYGIRITRVFDAPRERVWKEWTEPEAFADWFGGPEFEVPLSTVSMDVSPGGAWRLTMLSDPGPGEIHWKGEYREVDKPERLVFTVSDQPGEDAYELVTVVLTDLGDGRTEMHFEQRGSLPPEQYERTREGWGVFFDRMAERMVPAVRRATGADAAHVARLLHDFNTEFSFPTPDVPVLAERARQLLADGEMTVLLGGDGPDGLVQLRFRPSIWSGTLDAYLEELYVAPARRGHGIGRALVEAALQVAREAGATRMDLGTSETDTAAIALYERTGFTNREGGPGGPKMLFYERDL